MDAEQARHVAAVLRRLGIPGEVAPEDPENASGPWRVYDTADPVTRRDVTADVLASVTAKFPEGRPGSGPSRGFVVPSGDE
ncbi:hypothetical protein FH609_005510 [Streptomyces sp. 3MP-14]|uniref:Uncharacterized protein n=1 Tax=Streptomyces mimosae TaxID=2586635 RepID=A0A5N6APX5_9ACTN|nr:MULTISPECIES: hypothetical protein [Streptomyces]KAB8169749.1 hypothetical protein FH607_003190 [Streptomyces mimosae]KAB8178497.1 hypothetical protein FH609_005510 [Streptomyces sp. 3MP-14]